MRERGNVLVVLPPFLREVREFRQLETALAPALDGLWAQAAQLRREAFVETAGPEGLMRFERVAGLAGNGEPELRRQEVRVAYMAEAPYTLSNVGRMLRGLASGMTVRLEAQAQRVELAFSAAQLVRWESLAGQLREMVPANLAIGMVMEGTFEFDAAQDAFDAGSGFAGDGGAAAGGALGAEIVVR